MRAQEAKIRTALQEFSVQKYVKAARALGRANLDTEVRCAAAHLYEQISQFRQEESLLSKELTSTLELAERVLFSEWLLFSDPVPRYVAYTNIRVLNWVLGTNHRPTLNSIWEHCRTTIRRLLNNFLSFEICSLAGVEPWQQDGFDPKIIRNRVDRLKELRSHMRDTEQKQFVHVNLDEIPDDWESYALDKSRTLALLHLTALPQTTSHDEFLFLRTIHISECCFWGVLTAVIGARESVKRKRIDLAVSCLTEAVSFAELLVPLFQAFQTMPPQHFAEFRDATGNASAIQSRTYQLMQTFTQGLDERKVMIIADVPDVTDLLLYKHPRFVDLRQVVQMVEAQKNPDGQRFISEAMKLDQALYAWRCLHLGIARRYLPPEVEGTGGTRGAPYLATHYKHKVFPTETQYPMPVDLKLTKGLKARAVLSSLN